MEGTFERARNRYRYDGLLELCQVATRHTARSFHDRVYLFFSLRSNCTDTCSRYTTGPLCGSRPISVRRSVR